MFFSFAMSKLMLLYGKQFIRTFTSNKKVFVSLLATKVYVSLFAKKKYLCVTDCLSLYQSAWKLLLCI